MKLTRLLIAAVLMAGLGGVVLWSNRQEKLKAEKPAADAAPKILSLKEADIRGLEITQRGEPPTVLKRADASSKWQIVQPKPLAADQGVISGITSALATLTSERVVDDHASDLPSYGLSPAYVSVKLTMADGKTPTLLVGDDTPGSGSVYAMLEGDPRLFTMNSGTKSTVDKKLNDLRDRRLITLDHDKVSRLELDAAGQPPVEFGRISQTEWQILKPKPMRADGFQVDDLLSRAQDAQMDASLSDEDAKKNVQAFASGKPIGTLTATDPTGTQKIEVRMVKDDYYAKSSVIDGATKITPDLGKLFAKKVDDFRNKKLFDFGFNDPTHIGVTDGSKTVTLDKSGDNWVSGGKTMDSVSVQALVDKLRDLSASKFAESGFTTPVTSLTVVSDSGKKTEKVEIAASGKDYLARRDGDTTLYQLDGPTVDDLRKTAGDVKPDQKKK